MSELERYSVITDKNPREIVLLRGTGCRWRRCRFCDYHLDYSRDEAENFELNRVVLSEVIGLYGRLEIINSGSFSDIDDASFREIERVCHAKGIKTVHFECHWRDRDHIPTLRTRLGAQGIEARLKIGVESFDADFRESILDKGIDETDPMLIAALFDECCLLAGLAGQTEASMTKDIETGLAHFSRVCVNLMTPNGAPLQPDETACAVFRQTVAPRYQNNPRIDILMENTDFGVGGQADA